jgi:hypothetical protein
MRVARHSLGALLLLVGWAALVVLAIDAGTSRTWGSVAGYAAGAALCLFLALLVFARLRALRRGELPVRRTPTHRASHRA